MGMVKKVEVTVSPWKIREARERGENWKDSSGIASFTLG